MPKQPANLHYFDGAKSTPLSEMRNWDAFFGGDSSKRGLSPLHAYKAVPWLYRAVDVRAKSLSKLPLALYRGNGSTDISEQDAYKPLVRAVRLLLHQIEASLCISAASYAVIERNQFQRNPTPRWLLTSTIEPMYTAQGVSTFKRHVNGKTLDIAADDMIAIWLPALDAEQGPGTPPCAVALQAAGVLHHLDSYLSAYFERGAIRATLLQIDGNPSKGEKEKLEAWWKRLLGGVKKAFETVAISAAVKPIVIGDSLKETVNKDLTQQQREDIATAMGVPFTLLNAIAANHATANQDWVNFYDQTILPECELIEGPLNDRYLSQLGLRLDFQPDKLECYQHAFFEKAKAIKELTGGPVLTKDEGRELLGYESWPEAEQPQPAIIDVTPQPNVLPADQHPALPAPASAAAKSADYARWERKALKALKAGKGADVAFDSTDIPIDDQQLLSAALAMCGTAEQVKHVFAHIKAIDLNPSERAVADAVLAVLARHGRAVVKAIMAGENFSLVTLPTDLKAALLPLVVEHVLDQAVDLAEAIGPEIDLADVQTAAAAWADSYTFDLVNGLTDSTQKVVQKAISQYQRTPGMTREQVESLLRPAFGEKRAEAIAVTEITRSAAQATKQYQQMLADAGLDFERVNRTNADDSVCVVCGPLDGKPESQWPNDSGPPWHVKCRCSVTLRRKRGTSNES
jgi:HK97 family phage portal protein